MKHPLVLAMFTTRDRAARAARSLHAAGVTREELSIVARDHEEAGELADAYDGDAGRGPRGLARSRPDSGELSAHVLAAVSVIVPGLGPALAAGPLAAELGEAAGHVAGSLPGVLRGVGIDEARAMSWQEALESGGVLLGVHAIGTPADRVEATLREATPDDLARTWWE